MNSIRTRLLICLFNLVLFFDFGAGVVQGETLAALARLSLYSVQAPTGVALGSNETLYVIESAYNRVVVIQNGGQRTAELRGFTQPICVAVDQAGRLYVGDGGSGSVFVFGADLVLQGKLGAGDREFGWPVGLSVNAAGDIFVVDKDRNNVRIYGANRQLKQQFGQAGSTAGQLNHPLDIAVDHGSNEIVIIDRPLILGSNGYYEGSRVQFFDQTGKHLRSCGANGVGEGKLAKAVGVAVDHVGKVYVSDSYQNIVEVFDRTGKYIETVYDASALMRNPVRLAIGGISDRLFISSVSGNRVDIYGPPQVRHVVTAESSAGGSITPAGAIAVTHGAALGFKIFAETGYHITGLYADGADLGVVSEYRIPVVVSDHTVRAEFRADVHKVAVETVGSGEVIPSGSISVPDQADLSLTLLPAQGFQVASVVVDGVSQVGGANSYTLSNVRAAHTVQVVFEQLPHVITATSDEHGAVSPGGAVNVAHGSDATFSFTPQSGYYLSSLLVDNNPVSLTNLYSFTNVVAPHSIRAEFAKNHYTISITTAGEGMVSPSGPIDAEYGETRSLALRPATKHHVAALSVDGQTVPLADSYTFTEIRANHALAVLFELDNEQPISLAGPDQTVSGGLIKLNGANSFDPDGEITSYLWEQTAGPAIMLTSPNQANTSFIAPTVASNGASLMFKLTVTDDKGVTSEDVCLVNLVRNYQPPVADAGPDQTVAPSAKVILDGSDSYDRDGVLVSYQWQQIGGQPVALTGAEFDVASFTAPADAGNNSALFFRLLVTDSTGLLADSECLVNVTSDKKPPIAEAGADQIVREGETVELNGTGSSAESTINSYLWAQTLGSPSVTLDNLTSAYASFTAPQVAKDGTPFTYQLLVTDQDGLVGRDSVTVLVHKALSGNDSQAPAPINKKSKGKWITVSIELPHGLSCEAIDVGSIAVTRVNGQRLTPALFRTGPFEISDSNKNGIPELTVKFDRQQLGAALDSGSSILTVTGRLVNGTAFQEEFRVEVKE